MKFKTLTVAMAVAATGFAGPVLFGPDGLTDDSAKALAELMPYEAPNPALRLTEEKVDYLGGGAFAVTRTVLNDSKGPVAFNDEFLVRDRFSAEHYLIPCVSYNGNEFTGATNTTVAGDIVTVKTPHGLSCDGEPWIFSYERTGIPACTLTENATVGVAVFAANDTPASLVSSCSLRKGADGRLDHVVIRPVVEAPYTYESKGVFAPRYDTYITLGPGKSFTAKTFVAICPPKWRNFAYVSLMDQALRLLDPKLEPCLHDDEVDALGARYARSLFEIMHGKWLLATNRKNRMFGAQHGMKLTREAMAEMEQWEYWTDVATFGSRAEIGWAGQNFLGARNLAVRAFRTDDKALLEKCIGVYEAFIATQQPSGLLHTHYGQNFGKDHLKRFGADACNMGWGAAEAVRMYRLLKRHGIDRPDFLAFARKLVDFFVEHWTDDYGFGKNYYLDGRPIHKNGTIGGFVIPALIELYEETGEKKYRDCAEKASDFYYARDLDNFVCTAGAIDCYGIDKETAYPFLSSSLALHRITGDRKYLERAEKAAAYFLSWMFYFDVLYGAETDFAKYDYHTIGGTTVGAEHQGIDPWGAILVPELFELSELTGDAKWRRIARLTWANAVQGITTRMGQIIRGRQRPIGSQNEAFMQARFNKYQVEVKPGYFNDLLVSWPTAYRLWTLERLGEKGIRMR